MKLREWIGIAAVKLEYLESLSPKLEAQLLAAKALGVERSWILAHSEEMIQPTEFDLLLERRLKNEPLAYILGSREFYGRIFQVEKGVLIPRQETETLIDAVLLSLPMDQHVAVLDIGTGTGCIAITLKLERPSLEVIAIDISNDALEIANKNAKTLGAEVKFLLSNGLTNMPKEIKFDCIVSNPPYIQKGCVLPPEIRSFEPEIALYGGQDGLDFYRRFAREIKPYLKPNGLLILEAGDHQADDIQKIFEAKCWKTVHIYKDLIGMPRVIAFKCL